MKPDNAKTTCEQDETIRRQADAYARATAATRCGSVQPCDNCSIRYCDYRSRVEAFMAGAEAIRNSKPIKQ